MPGWGGYAPAGQRTQRQSQDHSDVCTLVAVPVSHLMFDLQSTVMITLQVGKALIAERKR